MTGRFSGPFRKRPQEAAGDGGDSRISLERVGRSRIDDMAASTRKVPWSLTMLQLLWTAGPVTFLAMQGGSWLGYGEPVSTDTYLFFAFYVVLAALIGLVARVVADAVRGRRRARARANLTRTLDMVPDLIFAVRDLNLAAMPWEQRHWEAANILLGKLDLGSRSVAMAVEDLTGERLLAETVERIEIYRRAGMRSRIQDWVDHSAPDREAALARLREKPGVDPRILEQRLWGIAPSQEAGIPRSRNFIGQIFEAAHHDDLSLMSLENVEDLLLLTFELLSGREFTRLVLDYEGDWMLARALDEVQRCQSEYRQVRATVHQRLHDLLSLLIESGLAGQETRVVYLDITSSLEQINGILGAASSRLLVRGKDRVHGSLKKETLQRSLRYARMARRAIERLQERHRRQERALARWERLRRKLSPTTARDGSRSSRQGLLIRERSIFLEDEQKLKLAEAFSRYVDEMEISKGSEGILQRNAPLTAARAKRLGIHLALVLDELIGLKNPSVQRAIDSSNGMFPEGLETGYSADAKAGLGAAAVKEINEDLAPAAELLALRLTRLYHLPLTSGMVEFLSETYGADRERLEYLSASARRAEALGQFEADRDERPIAEIYRRWHEPLQQTEKMLMRLTR
ncbi:hypothetical protein [Marinobacter sp.]|uniref:hypothetical protein n=1 Tax=Marinobacter sp. TaxID=50741 RepID=UPI0038509DEB